MGFLSLSEASLKDWPVYTSTAHIIIGWSDCKPTMSVGKPPMSGWRPTDRHRNRPLSHIHLFTAWGGLSSRCHDNHFVQVYKLGLLQDQKFKLSDCRKRCIVMPYTQQVKRGREWTDTWIKILQEQLWKPESGKVEAIINIPQILWPSMYSYPQSLQEKTMSPFNQQIVKAYHSESIHSCQSWTFSIFVVDHTQVNRTDPANLEATTEKLLVQILLWCECGRNGKASIDVYCICTQYEL